MKTAPIVLFTYKRPWHTRQTVEALQKNELASESELFIFSDGAKNEDDMAKVQEVRSYLKTIDGFKKITIIERDENLGLANNIIDGVTSIVNKYGKVIVLEDDLVTSPYFLRFMNEALERYKEEEKVMHISGYIYPIKTEGLDDTFFIKPTSCWGWATWDSAWRFFKKDPDYYITKFDRHMIRDFNVNHSYPYFEQIILNKKGKLNTWAIFWYASVYLRGGLSLHPRESFVRNVGFGEDSVHCKGKGDEFDVKLNTQYKIKFTDSIQENVKARNALEKYFKSIQPPIWKRLAGKILLNGVKRIIRIYFRQS